MLKYEMCNIAAISKIIWTLAVTMLTHSWLKFSDMFLFTVHVVILICMQTSNLDVFGLKRSSF